MSVATSSSRCARQSSDPLLLVRYALCNKPPSRLFFPNPLSERDGGAAGYRATSHTAVIAGKGGSASFCCLKFGVFGGASPFARADDVSAAGGDGTVQGLAAVSSTGQPCQLAEHGSCVRRWRSIVPTRNRLKKKPDTRVHVKVWEQAKGARM